MKQYTIAVADVFIGDMIVTEDGVGRVTKIESIDGHADGEHGFDTILTVVKDKIQMRIPCSKRDYVDVTC